MFGIRDQVDTGVVHINDIKTLNEVVEITGINEALLKNNITMMKKKRSGDPEKLIAGVDYIESKNKRELYTPVGIKKLTKGLN